MKKQMILGVSALLLSSGLYALTTEEQVAANTIGIGVNSENITSLKERVSELEAIIIRLEAHHNIRQFTINGTSGLDITLEEFKNKISSLNYQSGEFLYIKGVNSDGKVGICTSKSNAANAINAYLNDSDLNGQMFNPIDLWYKTGTTSPWTQAYYADLSTYGGAHQIQYYARNSSNTESVSMSVIPDEWDNHYDPRYQGAEIYVNGWDTAGDKSITFKVAPTRLEACGF